MRNSKWLILAVILTIIALGVAACGGASDNEAPEPQPTAVSQADSAPAPTDAPQPTDVAQPAADAAPTDTPQPQPTDTTTPTDVPQPAPVEGDELDPDALSTLADMSSYRSSMRMVMEGTDNGEEVAGTIEFMVEYTSDPLVQHVAISSEGLDDAEEFGNIEMYQTAEMSYMFLGNEWLSMPADEGDLLGDAGIIGADDMLDDTCGWQSAGDTEFNGVPAQHWTLSQGDLEECLTTQQLAEMGGIDNTSGELYVAKDGNYVLHMELMFEGTDLEMGVGSAEDPVDDGSVQFIYEMSDVNVPFTIQIPEEALGSGGLPPDIPVPADAEETTNMFGMITFYSPSSPQDVADFYQAEMPNNGWTEVSADEMGGMHMLEFSKGDRTASLMITLDDSGRASVMIQIEGGE